MARIRAPELAGRGWVGAPDHTTLASLRGRFVLLDFWTFCCVNCLHVLDELRPLEQRWHEVLTVVGVHSPKFAHEAEPGAVEAAVARYGVTHPVLDDAEMTTWQAYAARAWPTLVLVDPEGYIVARYAGEGHAHAIEAVLTDLVPKAEKAGSLRRDGGLPAPPSPTSDGLAYPGGLLALADGRLLVADTAHHRLVLLDADTETVLARIGTGARGLLDGPASTAAFNEPRGMCLLPTPLAAEVGYDVVVADTVNHALRGLSLGDLTVRTLAGTGSAWSPLDPTALSSPWDVAWWDDRVWIAMAGIHQLWTFDPLSGSTQPAAGTRTEGLRDGPLAEGWFAQPSGLAACGGRLWLADAETSALRWVEDGQVHTAVGTGLFDFGFADGGADAARLQHPLGVATAADAAVLVADTYNGALRHYDPATGLLTTLADGFSEPAQVVVRDDVALVLESGAHRVVAVGLDARTAAPKSSARTERAPTPIAPGAVDLVVGFVPPPGQHLDERYGAATRLRVSATPAALLRSGEGTSVDLVRRLEVDASVGDGVLHVTASAASCDVDSGEGAACHLHQQDWGIPVVVRPDADSRLDLALGALNA